MQRFWVQSFPDPGRRRIKWRPAAGSGTRLCTHLVALHIKGVEQDPRYCLSPVSKVDRLSMGCQDHARHPWGEWLLGTKAVEISVKGSL